MQYTMFFGTNSTKETLGAIWRCLRGKNIQNGAHIAGFEREFAAYLGATSAYSFATARMALYAILKATRDDNRDEVILPAYTCVVVPAAILYAGCRPVYVDILPDTLQIDVSQVRAKITPRTRAIIAPHNFGLPCDIDILKNLARVAHCILIEDCAHALGSKLRGQHLGTFGDFAVFSTDGTKNISTGFGGIAVVNNEEFDEPLARIQGTADFLSVSQIIRIVLYFFWANLFCHPALYRIGKYVMAAYRRSGLAFLFPGCDRPQLPRGYPFPARLSNVLCWVGQSQLKKMDEITAHRKRVYSALSELLQESFELQKVGIPDADIAPLRVSFLVRDRREFCRLLNDCVEVGKWFDTVFQNYRGDPRLFGYEPGQCPVAEAIASRIVNLPTTPRTDMKLVRLLQEHLRDDRMRYHFVTKRA